MAHPAAEWYYAVKNYTGTSEEQLSVVAGEPLHLLDDSDNEWWYAISPRTEQAGYIPALFIESTQSRIARVNAVKNKKLLTPTPEDIASTKVASHSKKIDFNPEPQIQIFFDEDAEDASILKRDQAQEDAFSAHGLIRVYAGIWDLDVTYKAIKVTPSTTTEEVIRNAVAKFMSVKNPHETYSPATIPQNLLESYSLYLTNGAEERKFLPDEFPMKELEKLELDEEQKKLVKFQLKKAVEILDGIPIRIFSEENLFKTILVNSTTTVSEAIKSAVSKFRSGRPEAFILRMVAGGKEKFLEGSENLHTIITNNRNEGYGESQKFFLSRKRLSIDALAEGKDLGVLRVYGGPLDLDVAYRALFIDVNTTAESVVSLTLEKYNSRDPPRDYQLSILVAGANERTLDKGEKPLELLRTYERERPNDTIKFMLKKAGSVPQTNVPQLKLSKIPMRIYCDFITKGGAPSSKPVLISENMTASTVVFLAIEKFNIKSNLTIQDYGLFIIDEEKGLKRQLLPEESPLFVKNEMGKKTSCHLMKIVNQLDNVLIRVHGNRIWPDETFETVFVSRTMTVNDVINLALEKFKYPGTSASMFQLIKVLADGSDIPNERLMEGAEQPFKERPPENVALVKKTDAQIPSNKLEEPEVVSEIDATAADVRKLLASDTILNVGDENLGEIEVGDLDKAFVNMTENISNLLKSYD